MQSLDRLGSDDAEADVRQRGRRSDEPRCCREQEGCNKRSYHHEGTLLGFVPELVDRLGLHGIMRE